MLAGGECRRLSVPKLTVHSCDLKAHCQIVAIKNLVLSGVIVVWLADQVLLLE